MHADNAGPEPDLELAILGVAVDQLEPGALSVQLKTTRGEIAAVFHPTEGDGSAVLCVGGARGGYDGPAHKLYARLGRSLIADRVSTLRVDYRKPGDFTECVLDVLGSLSFLKGLGARRTALVGHSFGAAVVIKAGELSPVVSAVASLSPQLYGTKDVARLAPRPLLLVHGMKDGVLGKEASEDIYARAGKPKRIILYAEADHSLNHDAEALFSLLREWLVINTRNVSNLN
jgi:uncharacterized protein